VTRKKRKVMGIRFHILSDGEEIVEKILRERVLKEKIQKETHINQNGE
jgi:hypothetical protein